MSELGEGLLEAIEKDFTEALQTDRMIAGILRKIDRGGTWADAEAYAAKLGELKSRALQNNITAAVLPEGRMSRELAEEILMPALEENYRLVLDAAAQVQESLNQQAGIGLKAVRPEMNTDRVRGLVERIGDSENFEDVSWLLGDPVVNFTQSVADETLEENAEFHAGAGLSPKIERIAEGNCCEWCAELEGEYDYDDKPSDIFRRHENCRCTVVFKPVKGKVSDVHSKKQFETARDARIARSQEYQTTEDRIANNIQNGERTFSAVKGIDYNAAFQAAKSGGQHSGAYNLALDQPRAHLARSVNSYAQRVTEHNDKIANPEKYVKDWEKRSPEYQSGLIRKWARDRDRNATIGEIYLRVWKERFG